MHAQAAAKASNGSSTLSTANSASEFTRFESEQLTPALLSLLSSASPGGDNTNLEKSPSYDMPTTSSEQPMTDWPSLCEPQRELLDEQAESEVPLERTRNKTSSKGKDVKNARARLYFQRYSSDVTTWIGNTHVETDILPSSSQHGDFAGN